MSPKGKAEDPNADNALFGKFDEMVDAVLGIAPTKGNIQTKAAVETWSVPLEAIYKNKDMRLDASHYDAQTAAALETLAHSGYPLTPLSEIAELRLPGLFSRIWAKDREHGIPYLNATDLMSLMSSGSLGTSPRFLSHKTDVDMEELIIREGWLLLTCSGTIGRVFYVPARLDGWVATHDLIRIVPSEKFPAGFLYSYLSSPIAQRQIMGHTHGGQIDHVTDNQIGEIFVPEMPAQKLKKLDLATKEALALREQALLKLSKFTDEMQGLISA